MSETKFFLLNLNAYIFLEDIKRMKPKHLTELNYSSYSNRLKMFKRMKQMKVLDYNRNKGFFLTKKGEQIFNNLKEIYDIVLDFPSFYEYKEMKGDRVEKESLNKNDRKKHNISR